MKKFPIPFLLVLAGCAGPVTMPPTSQMTPDERAYAHAVDLETTASLCEDLVNRREAMRNFPYVAQATEYVAAKRKWEHSYEVLRTHLMTLGNRSGTVPPSMQSVHERYATLCSQNGSSPNPEWLTPRAEEFLLILTHFKEDCAKRKGKS